MAHPHTRSRARSPSDPETAVLRGVAWVMLALGVVALAVFAREPDFHAYPGVLLLGITGVIGFGLLRLLAWALASRPPR